MHIIRTTRSLTRKYLHLLLREQLLKMNLSFGIGEGNPTFYNILFIRSFLKGGFTLKYIIVLHSVLRFPIFTQVQGIHINVHYA